MQEILQKRYFRQEILDFYIKDTLDKKFYTNDIQTKKLEERKFVQVILDKRYYIQKIS